MPYIRKEKRGPILADLNKVVDVGDLNFVYTVKIIIPTWVAEPRYKTIEAIRGLMTAGVLNDTLRTIDTHFLRKGWTREQIQRAKDLAFDEFYRRVGVYYENHACFINGDVYAGVEFAMPIKPLVALKSFTKPLTSRKKKGGE